MNVILIGFRGAGKSVVGQMLARKLGKPFLDLDGVIEEAYGGSIPEIFEKEGEEGFRERETKALEGCTSLQETILAVGGGAVLRERNREILRTLGFILYLRVDKDEAFRRIEQHRRKGFKRPHLTRLPMKEEIASLLTQREPIYRSLSDCEIGTTGKSADAVSEAALEYLKGRESKKNSQQKDF